MRETHATGSREAPRTHSPSAHTCVPTGLPASSPPPPHLPVLSVHHVPRGRQLGLRIHAHTHTKQPASVPINTPTSRVSTQQQHRRHRPPPFHVDPAWTPPRLTSSHGLPSSPTSSTFTSDHHSTTHSTTTSAPLAGSPHPACRRPYNNTQEHPQEHFSSHSSTDTVSDRPSMVLWHSSSPHTPVKRAGSTTGSCPFVSAGGGSIT